MWGNESQGPDLREEPLREESDHLWNLCSQSDLDPVCQNSSIVGFSRLKDVARHVVVANTLKGTLLVVNTSSKTANHMAAIKLVLLLICICTTGYV